ncbi:MAG: NAD(P)H-hydrate dehydratase [Candidatus Omnitrophica bacterium]|nr:NAD(P)H-hydrate dehydratase [Candidatus Omnitrophota bacterium]
MRNEFRKLFPPRPKTSHKGDFGRLLIVSGSTAYPGAPYLASLGALRAGAGLVSVGVPRSIYPVLARKSPEAMPYPLPETRGGALSLKSEKPIRELLKGKDVLALGPGLSRNTETQRLIRKIVESVRMPLVIDADGLNALEGKRGLLAKLGPDAVLTPHPGEARRLTERPVPEDDRGRMQWARIWTAQFRAVLVLKGRHTIVASRKQGVYVNRTGNPGMAKGGSGDILTGILAAFLGRKLEPFQAAKAAVYLHGLAADLALPEYGENSLLPTDVLKYLPQAFKKALARRGQI